MSGVAGIRAVADRLGRSVQAIRDARHWYGLTNPIATTTKMPLVLVDMRARAKDLGLTYADVGRAIDHKFVLKALPTVECPSALFAAAELMGGSIYAVWDN